MLNGIIFAVICLQSPKQKIMKTTQIASALFIRSISIFFLACDKPDEFVSLELLDNASVEDGNQTPARWFVVEGDYQKAWSELESSEGIRSLELTSDITGG